MGLCTQVEVSYDDQKRINTFSKLNTRMHDLEAQVKAKKVRHRSRRAHASSFVFVLTHALACLAIAEVLGRFGRGVR